MIINVIPMSKDYKSKAAIKAALLAGKDFRIADISNRWDGKPINLSDMRNAGYTNVTVRYKNKTSVALINLVKL